MGDYRKALKNYTTGVNTKKMIQDIQSIILDFGGTGIIFEYDSNRRITALLFKIIIEGNTKVINVPFMIEKTRGVLMEQGILRKEDDQWSANYKKSKELNDEQAYRVTLANIRDWLDAQLAIYATQMFEFPQIFLPYMVNQNGQTFYEAIKQNNFLIGAPSDGK